MKKGEVSERAQLLFDYSELLSYVRQIEEAVSDEFYDKLEECLKSIVTSVKAKSSGVRTDYDGGLECRFWPSSQWESEDSDDNRLVVYVELTNSPLDESSELGVTVQGRADVLKALKAEHQAKAAWMKSLTPEHGTRKSKQLTHEFEWFEDYEDFADLQERLSDEIAEVLNGIRKMLKAKKLNASG